MYNFLSIAFLSTLHSVLFAANLNTQSVDEYVLKAIWIEKFTHFITWPKNVQADTTQFVIAVYSSDPFEGNLEKLYSNSKINERSVKIEHLQSIDDLQSPHILFLSNVKDDELEKILIRLKNKPVLIISDASNFAAKGTHINFFLVNNSLRIEINETALKESGLFASFRLLNIAKIVNPIGK